MKKRSIVTIIGSVSLMLLAGCGSKNNDIEITDDNASSNESVQVQEEATDNASNETAVNDGAGNLKLPASECEAEIDKLLQTEEVKPDNEEILGEMAHCVTASRILDDGNGKVFAEMENDRRASIRRMILNDVLLGNTPFSGAIKTADSDAENVTTKIPVEDAVALFKDVYGEENFTPFESEQVKDGCIPFSFADGEPWNSVEHMKYYEDEGYYLFTGPAFYSDNSGDTSFLGYADILYAKNPESRYGVTLLYGRYRDEKIKVTSVETSSELQPSANKTYTGMNLVDGDYSTVWAEGVQGTGVGETVTLHLDKKQLVYGVLICNGYTENDKLFSENGTVTGAKVDFGSGKICEYEMEGYAVEGADTEYLAGMNNNAVELDEPVMTDTITITIKGAQKGEKYDDTCLSEILVY
ncbi:MAG: hypothetical protein J5802_11745 [Butyrivibrio sp.]|nr:hypothetical protein [Butyrivibrio sp.]